MRRRCQRQNVPDDVRGAPSSRSRTGRSASSPLFSGIGRRLRALEVFGTELLAKRGTDLELAQEERSLVESASTQPSSDFVAALARVAGTAGRHHVVERVPAATGDRQHAVALHRHVGHPAVGATAPGPLEHDPLGGGEVVLDTPQSVVAGVEQREPDDPDSQPPPERYDAPPAGARTLETATARVAIVPRLCPRPGVR